MTYEYLTKPDFSVTNGLVTKMKILLKIFQLKIAMDTILRCYAEKIRKNEILRNSYNLKSEKPSKPSVKPKRKKFKEMLSLIKCQK